MTAVNTDASHVSINACGTGTVLYHEQDGKTPIKKAADIVKQAEDDVLVLHQRAIDNNGKIVIVGLDPVIKANKNKLILEFPSANPGFNTDNVTFHMDKGQASEILPGALMCSSDNDLYPNKTFVSLEHAVKDTTSLG